MYSYDKVSVALKNTINDSWHRVQCLHVNDKNSYRWNGADAGTHRIQHRDVASTIAARQEVAILIPADVTPLRPFVASCMYSCTASYRRKLIIRGPVKSTFCNTQFIPSYAILQPNYFYQFLNPYTDLTSISWSCSMATCLPSRVSAMCQLIWLLTSFTKPGGKEQVLGDLQSNTKHYISSCVWRGMIVHVQAKSFQATVMQYLA